MYQFRFDLLSFWIGFLAATLLWGAISFLRPRFPIIRNRIKKTVSDIQARNTAGIDAIIRKEILKRCQSMHSSSDLFALDEIIITPRVILPPSRLDIGNPDYHEALIDQSIPYTPDWPELASSYGVSTSSLASIMENGANIALIGEPGVGKTVALAHFASQISRKHADAGIFIDFVPCLIHVLDMDLNNVANLDPLDSLIKAFTGQFPLLIQPSIPRYLRKKCIENKVILLLDGIDELQPADISKAREWLDKFIVKNPALRIVAACSPQHIDGLLKSGLYPVALANWNYDDFLVFTHRWDDLWSKHISQGIVDQVDISQTPSYYMQNWIENEIGLSTPYEWTLKVKLAYSNQLNGFSGINWMDVYLQSFFANSLSRRAIEQLAAIFCTQGKACLPFNECEKIITDLILEIPPTEGEPTLSDNSTYQKRKNTSKETKVSQGGWLLSNLVEEGLFVKREGDRLSFSHPLIGAYLASCAMPEDPPEDMLKSLNWPLAQSCLAFLASRLPAAPWIDGILESDMSPLLSQTLIVGRWLRNAPPNAAWRSKYMRKLIGLIQKESLPASLRARLISVCITANDPTITLLLKQLFLSRSHIVRKMAALTYGAMPSVKTFDELLELLVDPVNEVRTAACIALSGIKTIAARQAVIDILHKGDELLQQVAAESLACYGEDGHAILRDALNSEDLLVRRSAILGITRTNESWVRQVLEKIAVEDSQWVVRNAAAHALETLSRSHSVGPQPLGDATQAAWLLEFAGKQGVGLRPDQPAVEMLINALKSGTELEKILAMRYLRLHGEEGIIGALYQIAFLEQGNLAESGLYAIWFITLSGAKLPALAQYGVM